MSRFGNLNPYDLHKHLINDYLLTRSGDTALLHRRDTSRDRTDADVLRENHKFLWDDDDSDAATTTSWEQQLAKKYYDKLFKEYCICDLSRYKENKVALRWRIQSEVIDGKGQFVCGNKACKETAVLRSWEVNFGYTERGQRKNALIKVRLCPDCSRKLNYHSKKREIKKLKKLSKKSSKKRNYDASPHDHNDQLESEASNSATDAGNIRVDDSENAERPTDSVADDAAGAIWSSEQAAGTANAAAAELRSREEEFDDYLEDLLL